VGWDVTAHARRTHELAQLALHDPLTGLANRVLFGERLHDELRRRRRTSSELALLYADLDGFTRYVQEAETDEKVAQVNELYQEGLLSEDERYMRVIDLWNSCTHNLRDRILPNLDPFNPIRMFTDSGARGSSAQVSQLAGMRGLMASPTGKTVELPIRANFREGLNVLEFFLSSHGSRKALSDTAMKTADSGYLTRRLVDISQEVIVREEDCFASRGTQVRGVQVSALMSGKQTIEDLEMLARYRHGKRLESFRIETDTRVYQPELKIKLYQLRIE
jgi:DNA-directed RNA polymerase beta' subunit